MIELGKEMGITSWDNSERFGLSLTLGGGEVKLIDLAGVYAVLANYGQKSELTSVIKAVNYKGKVLEENNCILKTMTPRLKLTGALTSPVQATEVLGKSDDCQGKQVLDPKIAFTLTDILRDNQARTPAFGSNSQLVIPTHSEVAVKTGTSNNMRDNLTIGYNQNYVVAVWVGNNDNSPMSRVASGVTGASPILLANKENHDWGVPPDLIQIPICSLTGSLPCQGCPTRNEWFIKEKAPKTACNPEQFKPKRKTKPGKERRIGEILEPAVSIER